MNATQAAKLIREVFGRGVVEFLRELPWADSPRGRACASAASATSGSSATVGAVSAATAMAAGCTLALAGPLGHLGLHVEIQQKTVGNSLDAGWSLVPMHS